MSRYATTTRVFLMYKSSAQLARCLRSALGLSIGASLPCATAEEPPTAAQLEAIRAHQAANRTEIAEGERKVRNEKSDYILKNFATTGGRGWIVSLRELNLPFEEGYPLFSKFLQHTNREVVAEAIFSLSELYGQRAKGAAQEILQAYEKDNDLVAFEAARSFPKIGIEAKTAVRSMTEKLRAQSASQRLRIITIQTLGSFGPSASDALPSLQKELASKDSRTAYEAFLAIGKVKESPKSTLAKLDINQSQEAFTRDPYSLLIGIRDGTVPKEAGVGLLHSALRDGKLTPPVEIMAVETLGLLAPSDPTSLDLILSRIGSADPTLSQIAEEAADKFVATDPRAIKPSADQLENPDDRVATAAATILIRFGERAGDAGPPTLAALKKITSATDIKRIGALLDLARSIGKSMETATPLLTAWLQENAPIYQQKPPEYAAEIRTFVLLTLSRVGITLAATPTIVDILANSIHPKEYAAACIAAATLPPGTERSSTVKYITRALAPDYPDSLITLKRFGIRPNTEEPEFNTSARVEAARALAVIGGPEAQKTIPLLKQRAADPWRILGLKESYQVESNRAVALLSDES